jgi:hypothetical protein
MFDKSLLGVFCLVVAFGIIRFLVDIAVYLIKNRSLPLTKESWVSWGTGNYDVGSCGNWGWGDSGSHSSGDSGGDGGGGDGGG